MIGITELEPTSVFKYFEEISKIPHGSGNMERISRYCMDFAEKHSLKAIRDESYNVVIYKPGTKGYENSAPVILQGHLDMVCQKTENCSIDFETDGLDIYVDGDYIKANGTTLGADNGIAVAMILSILESDNISHPPIEAVFTTDEEIGMVGALALRSEVISASKMINIDSEDASVITVSCAGGSDFCAEIPIVRKIKSGTTVTLCVKGLSGGHSGVEINSGRVNSNILIARILNHINQKFDFDIMCINGGDKGNAIPLCSTAKILCDDSDALISEFVDYCKTVKEEISAREPGFAYEYCVGETKEQSVISTPDTKKLIYHLLCSPNGVVEMSAEINGLVETSLNMGILETREDIIRILYALRSNKQSALSFLEEKLTLFFS
jgi:dipeptidase D